MKRLLIAALLCASSAQAADIPQGSSRDGRIQYANYHDGDIVTVYLQTGIASRIVLDKGETVLTAASGFTDGYDISFNGRILTIQPLSVDVDGQMVRPTSEHWRTNLAVETDKRLYDFDIQLLPEKPGQTQTAYRVEFRYPVEVAAAKVAKVEQEQAAAIKAKPVRIDVKNTDYSMRVGKRSQDIAPVKAFDDAKFTYLEFVPGSDMPAVFMTGVDGESVVNTHMEPSRPATLVIQRTAREFMLRLGKAVVSVRNNSYSRGVR